MNMHLLRIDHGSEAFRTGWVRKYYACALCGETDRPVWRDLHADHGTYYCEPCLQTQGELK